MLRVPPGTSSGKKLRVKGRGVAVKALDPGDLFAEIQIVLPPTIDDKSRELVQELENHWDPDATTAPRRDLRF